MFQNPVLRVFAGGRLRQFSRYLIQIETIAGETQLLDQGEASSRAAEAMMWHKQHEYSMAQLLDHPVLRMAIKTMGMDRRAVELLLERAEDDPDRQPDRADDPVVA